jgi:hypothetical protein
MPTIRDQYHDPSYSLLYHLLQERPAAAEFVKQAELNETQEAQLPDSAFAWPERRLFPIDTPESTVLSCMYREKCAAVPVEVDQALAKAAEIYGVNAVLEQQKVAEAPPPDKPEDYLLQQHKRLRVKTAADVKVAEKILLEQYPRLSIEDRAEGFINLVKKARDMNVSLDPTTHRMAGMTVCTTKLARDAIEARAMATKEPLFREAYDKLASAFRGREVIRDRDDLVTAADALARLDKQAGLDRMYDKQLPDPIRTVFNTEKLAEEMVNVAGREIPLSKLAALPTTFWDDVVGPDMSKELTDAQGAVDPVKLGQVLDTLPLDLKLILKNQVP